MPFTFTLAPPRGAGERECRTLASGTLSVGRAANNDWVLQDPNRHMSKTHCVLSIEGGRLILTDLSTNGVFINGARQPTTRDDRIELTDGDEFRIGEHSIAVAQVATVPQPVVGIGRNQAGDGGPLDVDPLDDPLGRPPPSTPGFVHPYISPQAVARGDDPFDLLDADKPRHAPAFTDDMFRGREPLDRWQGPAQPDSVDGIHHAFTPPRAIAGPPADVDFDALIGDFPMEFGGGPPAPAHNRLAPPAVRSLPAAAPGVPPAAARPAPLGMPPSPAFRSPSDDPLGGPPDFDLRPPTPVVAPAEAPAPPARSAAALPPSQPQAALALPSPDVRSAPQPPMPSAAGPAGDPGALITAFLEGAGVAGLKLPDKSPELAMREAGAIFRAMVEGLRLVLMSRAAIKNELRVEQTMLGPRDNNPLKFSISAADAVMALLAANPAVHKPPLEAAREAFADIQSHELAVMAGVQSALSSLLKRFSPETLESRLQRGVLPGSRRARNWDLYCATYREIAREADDDFQAVFGREFARAYEAQIRKLSSRGGVDG
jgi:type VI secretion system FHA domain protein